MKRRIIILLLILFYLFSNFVNAIELPVYPNIESIEKPEVFAESAILVDVNSSKILYEKEASKKMYPASTTKLMTALLTIDNCKDLSQKAKVSYHAVHSIPSSYAIANLVPGEEMSVKDLLYALLVPSANDAAYVLAEYIANGGNNYDTGSSQSAKDAFETSFARFADMMNEKANSLGCKNTHFVNPNGIHNENHVSSAYDLALIGLEALKSPVLKSICETTEYSLPNTSVYAGSARVLKTTNMLISKGKNGYYEYANGLKTGFTDPAQECIVASASKDGRNLLTVVLHSESEPEDQNRSRESDCKRIFEYGFNSFSNNTLTAKNSIVQTINLWNGTKETKSLNVLCNSDLKALIIKGQVIDVTPEISINVSSAPISKGEKVGEIKYEFNGDTLSADLVAEHDVVPIDFRPYLLGGAVIVLIALIVLLKNKKI